MMNQPTPERGMSISESQMAEHLKEKHLQMVMDAQQAGRPIKAVGVNPDIVGTDVARTSVEASQRPSGIPRIAVDQAQRYCVFMLMNRNDRKRLAEWVHPGLEKMATGRDFWYYEIPRDRPQVPLTLMHQQGTRKQ